MGLASPADVLHDFDNIRKELIGIYLDSLMGFRFAVDKLEKGQREIMNQTGINLPDLDKSSFSHYTEKPTPRYLHGETQGDFKQRMGKDGKNYRFAANMYVSALYSYWEDEYRGALARALGIDKNQLTSDIMGDLRLIRNSIIHHKGIALPNMDKCKIIRKFKVDDLIQFSQEEIVEIDDHVGAYIDLLFTDESIAAK